MLPLADNRGIALVRVLIALLAIETAWLVYPWLRHQVIRYEESSAARGRRIAADLGCFNCHGAGGKGGVPNLGSRWDTVPSFHEGTPMMFAKTDEEIREYILDGAPAAKRGRESYKKEMAGQAILMPAYRGWVSDADVDAMVQYVRAASELLQPEDEKILAGGEIVREKGCFHCHGEMGSGGLPNPGSLKGYIPGFLGEDFIELVRDERELIGWITDGGVPRLREDPIASFFLERQRIQMPAFGRFLSAAEIEAVAAYVRWLASAQWQTLPMHE
jgi:mono/diheme cytochrome c family protein